MVLRFWYNQFYHFAGIAVSDVCIILLDTESLFDAIRFAHLESVHKLTGFTATGGLQTL
jgi:hypothetical protein